MCCSMCAWMSSLVAREIAARGKSAAHRVCVLSIFSVGRARLCPPPAPDGWQVVADAGRPATLGARLNRNSQRWNLGSTPMSPQGERCALFFQWCPAGGACAARRRGVGGLQRRLRRRPCASTVEKNLQGDVGFPKPGSSFRCQADERKRRKLVTLGQDYGIDRPAVFRTCQRVDHEPVAARRQVARERHSGK